MPSIARSSSVRFRVEEDTDAVGGEDADRFVVAFATDRDKVRGGIFGSFFEPQLAVAEELPENGVADAFLSLDERDGGAAPAGGA